MSPVLISRYLVSQFGTVLGLLIPVPDRSDAEQSDILALIKKYTPHIPTANLK
jgi:hypothetical protein